MVSREISREDRELAQRFKYDVKEVLGEGKFSQVYKGRDTQTNEIVAIKLISKETFNANPEIFLNEIDLMKKLPSGGFVKIITSYLTEKGLHIVMEYCEGGSLAEVISKKTVSEMEALDIALQIITAFVELPSLGFRSQAGKPATLLHRDIKPGNILLKNGKIKIADLGLAEIVEVAKMNDQIHEKEAGTVYWMSPQILRRLKYSTKSDIFSLGIVLFELIHKELPWGKPTQYVLSEKILTKSPEFKDNLLGGTIDLIMGMLTPNEEDRLSWEGVVQHSIFERVRKEREAELKRKAEQEMLKQKYVYFHPQGYFRILRPISISASY